MNGWSGIKRSRWVDHHVRALEVAVHHVVLTEIVYACEGSVAVGA